MGIKYKCSGCGVVIKFPDTPNFENDRWERLAHTLYSAAVNNKKMCWTCELKIKRRF